MEFRFEELVRDRAASGKAYHEFLREPAMSAGVYCLEAGGIDGQSPHSEDEIYYVVSGRAKFFNGTDDVDVEPGAFLYVPARTEHRFHTIVENLTVLVVFAPAETLS